MPKLAIPSAALMIRIAIVGLGLALFLGEAKEMSTPAFWIHLIAPAFFLWPLYAASGAFVRLDRGEAFGPAMVRTLKEMGYGLMIGAFAAVVVQPSLIYLFANGFTEMRGVQFDLNVENVTLFLVGVVLNMLAREGQKLRSKLDEFV